MSTSLIPLANKDLAAYSASVRDEMTAGGADYLPRVQLVAATSALAAKVSSGNFAFCKSKDNVIDLTREFQFIPINFVPKAAFLASGQTPRSSTKLESPEYQDLLAKAKAKMDGFVYGPEFLIWVPSQEAFATYHLNNATSRKESDPLFDLFGQGAQASSTMRKGSKGNYWGPTFTPYTAPIANLPTAEEVEEAEKLFALSGNPSAGGKPLESADGGDRPR
jgi:hypothetical protein